MTKRRLAAAVGALVLIVGVVTGRERPALEIVQQRAPRAAADDGIDLSKLRREASPLPQTDPFKSAIPEQKRTVESKPTAPALPFQYFGKLTENGKTEVYVMRGQDLLSISAGQTLGEYRVDQVSDARISFTYLPLKTKQNLELPAVN